MTRNLLSRAFVFLMAFIVLNLPISAKKAEAYCCACDSCWDIFQEHLDTQASIIGHVGSEVISFILDEILGEFTPNYISPALSVMTMEFSGATQSIMPAIGAMLDGQFQQRSILEIERLRAETTRDHIPSVSMCEYATLAKSVGASDFRKDLTQNVMSKYGMDRKMGVRGLTGSDGADAADIDLKSRFKEFLDKRCDPSDEGGYISDVHGAACQGADENLNRDIDYTSLLHYVDYTTSLLHESSSLDIDLTDGTSTPDENDAFAMIANLYSSDLALRHQREIIENPDNKEAQLDYRSLMAKKSVAENSFYSLLALKTKNPNSNNDLSYFEEMENLTKRHYQDPSFYANLYDNPANVSRQKAALEGIGLMQQRDIYESQIRSELLLSVLLEAKLEELSNKREGF